MVELAGGGLDYANPDMLCSMWPEHGEGKEYEDPREALKAAILVRDAWITSLLDQGKLVLSNAEDEDDGRPRVETGHTMGFTMPFCSYPADEELAEWAEKRYAELVKCSHCETILPDEYMQRAHYEDDDDPKFCPDNDNCISLYYGQCDQCGNLLEEGQKKKRKHPWTSEDLVFCCEQCEEDWAEENEDEEEEEYA